MAIKRSPQNWLANRRVIAFINFLALLGVLGACSSGEGEPEPAAKESKDESASHDENALRCVNFLENIPDSYVEPVGGKCQFSEDWTVSAANVINPRVLVVFAGFKHVMFTTSSYNRPQSQFYDSTEPWDFGHLQFNFREIYYKALAASGFGEIPPIENVWSVMAGVRRMEPPYIQKYTHTKWQICQNGTLFVGVISSSGNLVQNARTETVVVQTANCDKVNR